MAKTFDTSRVGGGTYELEQDSSGNYKLKSVGFQQVNKLNLPNLTNLDIPQATIGPITKLPVKPDVADPYKKLAGDQGDNNRDRIISQNYKRINPKDISVRQASVSELGQKTNTTYNAMSDAEKASVAAGTSGMTFKGAGDVTKQYTDPQKYGIRTTTTNPMDIREQAAVGNKAQFETFMGDAVTMDGPYSMSTAKTYSTPRTIADQNKFLGRTFTDKTTGLQKVKSNFQKIKDKANKIVEGSATLMVLGGIGKGLKTFEDALLGPDQVELNTANKKALNALGYKTNAQLGIMTDPGRVAGNPADSVFAGMNATSAFGDISKGAASRISTRNKTAMKKAGTWTKEKLDKFNAKTKEFEKQKAEHDAAAAKDKAQAQAAKDNRAGVGGSCFIAGTKVTMSDGTLKNIENIVVGDKVKGHKEDNTVIKLDPTLLADRKLYSFNDNEHYFFTSEHPFMTEEGWKSIKPEKTKERDGIELYKQLKGELKVGDKLVTDNGSVEVKDIKSKEISNPEMPLYNFNVSNDNSYIADDYVVHNKGCFIKGTLVTMADGSTKPVEQVDLGDEVAEGGSVFAVGRFLNTELYDYKGVKVSGSHMVNEDGVWMRVKDTKHGKSLGNDLNTVYVFGSENRRILINGILFTDYFEVNEQDKLIEDSEDFFNNWKDYGNNVDVDNVATLNMNYEI